jgi:hypothetical protein
MVARFAIVASLVALLAVGGKTAGAVHQGWGTAQFWGLACLQTECGEGAIGQTVVAMIGDVECGEDVTAHPVSDGEEVSGYAIDVLTDAQKPGCAQPGDTIRFFIGGEPASPTAVWEEDSHNLDIHTGPAFATFRGGLTCRGEPCIEFVVGPNTAPLVRAYVNGKLCASHAVSGWLITSYYSVNIPSAEAVPGCGVEGATVMFTVDGAPAKESGIWTVGTTGLSLSTDGLTWGDINCSGAVDPVDALGILRGDAGLPVLAPGLCPVIGVSLLFGDSQQVWGDVDCLNGVDPVDALKTLMFDVGLPPPQEPLCPALGASQ